MGKFDDMVDWIIDQACHADPFQDLQDCFDSLGVHESTLHHVKANKATCEALSVQHKKLFGTGAYYFKGLPLIYDNILPDNVYKFD